MSAFYLVPLEWCYREGRKQQCGGHFNGMIECNATGLYTKLRRGSWIGKYTYRNLSKIVASNSPFYYPFSDERFFQLPNDTEKLDFHLCHKINRRGILCSKCRKGYGSALQGLAKDCIKCDAKNVW